MSVAMPERPDCPSCGEPIPRDSRYRCPGCGHNLVDDDGGVGQ